MQPATDPQFPKKKLAWFPPPTHSYKFRFKYPIKTGWKSCRLAVPNNVSKKNAITKETSPQI